MDNQGVRESLPSDPSPDMEDGEFNVPGCLLLCPMMAALWGVVASLLGICFTGDDAATRLKIDWQIDWVPTWKFGLAVSAFFLLISMTLYAAVHKVWPFGKK